MKRAFSLIESVFALVILAFVFGFFYLSYASYAKNKAFANLEQKLFDEEKALQNAPTQEIEIFVENVGILPFSQSFDEKSFFGLKSLTTPDTTRFFKDEKSF